MKPYKIPTSEEDLGMLRIREFNMQLELAEDKKQLEHYAKRINSLMQSLSHCKKAIAQYTLAKGKQ